MEMKQTSLIEYVSDLKGYERDIRLEMKFAEQIKSILGRIFIKQDENWDVEKATDFLVLTIEPIRVAVRLRRHQYYEKYKEQITIRWTRPTGNETEIHKIRKGNVSHLFYGFVNADENEIIQYIIGDLNVFRESEPVPYQLKSNKNPPDSSFAVYMLKQFPKEFIVSRG